MNLIITFLIIQGLNMFVQDLGFLGLILKLEMG